MVMIRLIDTLFWIERGTKSINFGLGGKRFFCNAVQKKRSAANK